MTTVFALLGATALYLTYLWLFSAIAASYLSNRKGYGERPGLASGLLLNLLGVVLWLVWPPKPESNWKRIGPWGKSKGKPEEPSSEPAAAAARPETQ